MTIDDAPAKAGFQDARRRLAKLRPADTLPGGAGGTLEQASGAADPPRTVSAPVVEGDTMRAHRLAPRHDAGFTAFLDGTQASRILDFVAGIAIIHGTVAAVIRERRDRRMATWSHAVEQRIYAPRRVLPDSYWTALESTDLPLVDTSDEAAPAGGSPAHPFTLRDAAIHRVGRDRERLELALADRWCRENATGGAMLFIDGGIGAGSERVAGASCSAGIVKSHRTMYVEGEALTRVLGLREGERSSVMRISSSKRPPLASWYLRLRDARGRDPMWGLVRVEVADIAAGDPAAVAARADQVSAWILAEAAPLALPDGRWDKMVYGIRDCEEFLRAVTA